MRKSKEKTSKLALSEPSTRRNLDKPSILQISDLVVGVYGNVFLSTLTLPLDERNVV